MAAGGLLAITLLGALILSLSMLQEMRYAAGSGEGSAATETNEP